MPRPKTWSLQKNDGSEYSFSIADIDSIIFSAERGAVTDIDGITYLTVKIGNQWWMAENLRVTHYRDSSEIPEVKNNNTWYNTTSGARCYYDNLPTYHDTYGCLYNWYAVDDSRGLAPEGWHIPSQSEWEELFDYDDDNYLKLRSKSGWDDDNGTDDYGFNVLPAGIRDAAGNFMCEYGYFWTSLGDGSFGQCLSIDYMLDRFWDEDRKYGFSVRCVKDAE